MLEASLRAEIGRALAVARNAADREQGALLDRTDLQRIIGQLCSVLQRMEDACDELDRDRQALSERLTRRHLELEWPQGIQAEANAGAPLIKSQPAHQDGVASAVTRGTARQGRGEKSAAKSLS
jgi:hypothetical protein